MVGHEPTASVAALRLAGRRSDRRALEALADQFPTAGVAVLRFDAAWAGLPGVRAVLESLTVPRG